MMKAIRTAFTVAAAVAATLSWGRSISLDLRPGTDGGAAPRVKMSSPVPGAAAAGSDAFRFFDLDAGAATVAGELAVGDELAFALFDDVAVTLKLTERMGAPIGGDVFLAEAAGCPGVKSAVVVSNADGLTIDVQDVANGKVYKVLSTAGGVKVVEACQRACTCGVRKEARLRRSDDRIARRPPCVGVGADLV
jgi:hypothetical protein